MGSQSKRSPADERARRREMLERAKPRLAALLDVPKKRRGTFESSLESLMIHYWTELDRPLRPRSVRVCRTLAGIVDQADTLRSALIDLDEVTLRELNRAHIAYHMLIRRQKFPEITFA